MQNIDSFYEVASSAAPIVASPADLIHPQPFFVGV
jgi:hypothetical protein